MRWSDVSLVPRPTAPPAKVGLETIRHSAQLYCAIIPDHVTIHDVVNMHGDHDTNVCVQANGPLCRVKGPFKTRRSAFLSSIHGEWKGKRHSLSYRNLRCTVDISAWNAVSANLSKPGTFLQFVAGGAHHKCSKRAALSPPLNEYTCKVCFWKFEKANSLQH